jgi:uncharacterized protein YcfL
MMKIWLSGFIAVMLLVGCSNSQNVGLTVDGEFQHVVMGNSLLANTISVEDISTVEANGHARGVVRIKNNSSSSYDIQYRFYWYDEQGLEVNLNPSAWKHEVIYGGDETSLSEVSVSPNGKEFRVQIREYTN